MLSQVGEALRIGFGFLWTAGWAIIMGLMITSFASWRDDLWPRVEGDARTRSWSTP